MKSFPYTVTRDSIVVVVNDKPVTVQAGAPNYKPLRQALLTHDWAEVEQHLGIKSSIEAWSKGRFKLTDAEVFYNGEKVPNELAERMKAMATEGKSPEPLMRFWEKLQKNPSMRSVNQLWPFLNHYGIPTADNGNILAYKGINSNYTDKYTGTVDNKPGAVCEMPRNKISDEPNVACHYGYHVGALDYARSFGSVVVVCEVDPADVVCIPYDESWKKMRVCRYRVIGNHNGELLPSTSYELEETEKAGAKKSKIMTGVKEETIDVEEIPTELDSTEKNLVKQGSLIMAIKHLRARTDPMMSLTDAKTIVYAYRDRLAKKKVVQKQLVERRADDATIKLKVPKKFRKMHKMDMNQLMKQPIEALRSYASLVLHIVGASKILGGKTNLVTQILKVRRNFN